MVKRPVLALLLSVSATSLLPAQSTEGLSVIRDVRVFDGETVAERQTVVISQGRIAAVGGSPVAVPAGAQEVAGEGRTLLPGLMDAHIRWTSPRSSPPESTRRRQVATRRRWVAEGSGFLKIIYDDIERFGRKLPTLDEPTVAALATAALAAATSAIARAFRMTDRGRIRVGMRADLLFVEGDPTTQIRDTRRMVAIWKRGVRAQRAP